MREPPTVASCVGNPGLHSAGLHPTQPLAPTRSEKRRDTPVLKISLLFYLEFVTLRG